MLLPTTEQQLSGLRARANLEGFEVTAEFRNFPPLHGVEVFMRVSRLQWAGAMLICGGVALFSNAGVYFHALEAPFDPDIWSPMNVYFVFAWLALILIAGGLGVIAQSPRFDRLQEEFEEKAFHAAPVGSYQSRTISTRVRVRSRMTMIPISAGFTALILTLVWVMFCLIYEVMTPVGIWLRLTPPYLDRQGFPDVAAPLVVHVSLVNHQPVYTIGGLVVPADSLPVELRKHLKIRSQWLVYIDGESATLELGDVARVIDVANTLHAKVVLLTPKARLRAAKP